MSKNIWIRRQQCPCGDWKCYVAPECENGDSLSSQLVKTKSLSEESMVTPYVGMIFKSDNDAFDYYANFARKNGFSIRKERSRSRLSPQLDVYKRDFVCYRSGFAPPRKKPDRDHHKDRKSVRCGCDAKMYLSKESVEGVGEQWHVVQFSNVHNHELLEDEQLRLLPAYRKIREEDQERILLLSKAGFPVQRIVKVLELEKGIQGGQLPFLERDVRNFIQNRKRAAVQDNEAVLNEKRQNDITEVLDACRASMEADEGFSYDCYVDENNKVENIAWSYTDAAGAYDVFGDVVYFDASYRSITCGMLFGVWFGIDNHGRTIVFGCVLLQDETLLSFSWALQTFVRFMNGRFPQTIVTDLDLRLRDAVISELPDSKHVTPILNILSNLSSWFSVPLGSQYEDFRAEFDALQCIERTEEFEFRWNQVVSRYGIGSDKHIVLLYTIRTSWASSYTRGYFLARMTATTAFSKSIHAFLKGVFSVQTQTLHDLFDQVVKLANFQNQTHHQMQYLHIKICIPIEEHARSVLTPYAFSALQQELLFAMHYHVSEMSNGSYLIHHFKKMDSERVVVWVPEEEQLRCSCKEFESSGIMCRHALRVFIGKNYFQLPDKCFPARWQRETSLVFYENQPAQYNDDEWFLEYQSLTGALFMESSYSRERADYVRGELVKEVRRLLNEVRNMSDTDGIAMGVTLSPTG